MEVKTYYVPYQARNGRFCVAIITAPSAQWATVDVCKEKTALVAYKAHISLESAQQFLATLKH